MAGFLDAYAVLFVWLSVGSGILFLGSLAALPWLVGKLPQDYFLHGGRKGGVSGQGGPVFFSVLVRNTLGLTLFIMGIIMLFIPGQGILTMVAGLIIMEFPGRSRVIGYLVGFDRVRQGLNWLRQNQGKPPLVFPVEKER